MEIEEQLIDFAERIQSGCGPYVGYDEVQQWPKGRLEEFLDLGVLIKTTPAKTVDCTECWQKCPAIEPTIEVLPNTGDKVGLYVCKKEGGPGLIKIPLKRMKRWEIVVERLIELGYMGAEVEEEGETNGRKTKFEKIAAIAKYLQARPNATSKVIGKAIGIDDSDVRHLWGPIKIALKEGKSALPPGYKNDGIIDGVDESASCKICREPLASSFECSECVDIIIGECKTCHFTNTHPKLATP